MATAYIHIGLPKSASSSIQASLAQARPTLRKHALVYPGTEEEHFLLLARFHPAGTGHFRFTGPKIPAAEVERRCAELIEEIEAVSREKPTPDLIISSEYFHRIRKSHIRQMRQYFLELGYDVKIVCYIRHPLALAQSSLQQNVKRGITDIETWRRAPRWPSAKDTLGSYMVMCGKENIVVRDLKLALTDGPVRDLLRIADYKGPLDEIDSLRRNEGLSALAVKLFCLAYKLPLSPRTRARLFRPLIWIKGPKFTLSQDICDQISDQVEAELAWLKAEFDITPVR